MGSGGVALGGVARFQKVAYRRTDFRSVRFKSEVTGIEETDIRVRQVTAERLGTGRQEERIVSAPDCEQRWLVATEVGVEIGIGFDVGFIVAEEIELDFVDAWPCQKRVVERVALRRDL